MILEAIFNVILSPVYWLISLLPSFGSLPGWAGDFAQLIGYALNIIPGDVWTFLIGTIIVWKFGLIAWATLEWIYKKIPGVN